MEEKSCSYEGFDGRGEDPTKECAKNNKFFIYPYGNPLAAIYDASAGFDDFKRWVLLVIGTLTAIIMMGTVGKVIADGRKETSVFRAVGAKRMDIDQIYLLYAALLAALSFAIAAVLGLIVALIFEVNFSPAVSVASVLAFNSPNADKVFHLIGFHGLDMLSIFAFAVIAGIASAILPLVTNTRRNPIKDMREE
jgi:ABC-type antimicrobial peptide transport system permease subunit